MLQDHAEEPLSTTSGFKLLYDPDQLKRNITTGSWQGVASRPQARHYTRGKPSSALGDHSNLYNVKAEDLCNLCREMRNPLNAQPVPREGIAAGLPRNVAC